MDPLTLILFASIGMVPVGLVVGLLFFPWRRPYPKLAWLLLLPVSPLASLLWGFAFCVTPGSNPPSRPWIVGAPYLFIIYSLVLMLVLPTMVAKRLRLSSAALGLGTFGATVLISFNALMMVTGDYI